MSGINARPPGERFFRLSRFAAISREYGHYQTAEQEQLEQDAYEQAECMIYTDPLTGEKDTKEVAIAESGIDITDITDYGNY